MVKNRSLVGERHKNWRTSSKAIRKAKESGRNCEGHNSIHSNTLTWKEENGSLKPISWKKSLIHGNTIRRKSRTDSIRGIREVDFPIFSPPNQAMRDFCRSIRREKRNRLQRLLPYTEKVIHNVIVLVRIACHNQTWKEKAKEDKSKDHARLSFKPTGLTIAKECSS